MSDWGQGSVNNTLGWGQGAKNNTLGWGESQKTSYAGETNISGTSGWEDVSSFAYDGVDDYLFAKTTWDTLDGSTSAFTISAWVKTNSLAATQNVWHSWDSGGSVQTRITIFTSGMVETFIGGSGSNWSRSTINLVTGQWYHIVMKLDASTGNRYTMSQIYINGVKGFTSNFFSAASMPNGFSASIGIFGYNATNDFNGNINELAVWPGYALTDAEVTAIYNNGKPTNLEDTPGLSRAPLNWVRSENGTWNGREWLVENYDNASSEQWLSSGLAQDSRQSDVPQQFTNTQSVGFDGVDDRISLPSKTQNFTNFTLSFWVKYGGGNYKTIVGGTNSTQHGILYAIVQAGGTIRYFDDTTGWTSLSGSLGSNTWNHIVITYNSSTNTLLGYQNGSLHTTKTGVDVSTRTTNAHSFDQIGSRANGTGLYNAPLDELAVFDTVLTQAQINHLYINKNASIFNPVHYWRFEDAGTTATDSGSGNIDGTLINFTEYSNDVPT